MSNSLSSDILGMLQNTMYGLLWVRVGSTYKILCLGVCAYAKNAWSSYTVKHYIG